MFIALKPPARTRFLLDPNPLLRQRAVRLAVGLMAVAGAAAGLRAPAAAEGATLVRDAFTAGEGDNVAPGLLEGTITDAGDLAWRVSGQPIRFSSPGNLPGGGRMKPDNVKPGADAAASLAIGRLWVGDAGSGASELVATSMVFNVDRIRLGFAGDPEASLAEAADACYAEVDAGGATRFVWRLGGEQTVREAGDAIPAGPNQVELRVSLRLDPSRNTVSGSVASDAGEVELAPTRLQAMPAFEQMRIEFVGLDGAGRNFPYLDDVEWRGLAEEPQEPE